MSELLDIEDLDADEIVKSFNEDERQLYDEMRELVLDTQQTMVVKYWEIGRRFSNVRRTAEQDKAKYGSRLVQRFTKALGWESSKYVYDLMRVADVWPNRDNFIAMASRTNGAFSLSFKHFVHLSLIADDKARTKLFEQTVRHCWTESQLRNEMGRLGLLENVSNNPTGRPPKLPASVSTCLTHITQTTSSLRRLIDEAWLCDQFNLSRELETMPPDRVTSDIAKSLAATEATLSQMLGSGQRLLDALRTAKDTATRRIGGEPIESVVIEGQSTKVATKDEEGESIADARRRQKATAMNGKKGKPKSSKATNGKKAKSAKKAKAKR